jgi:hypothetical protein
MTGWEAWAANLASLRPAFRRPPGVFGMLTDDELHFLETYARFSYSGAGKIIDLGTWLGASAGALARGLRFNPHRNRYAHPIQSFDQFLWQSWMTPIAQSMGAPSAFRDGDDFLDYAAGALGELLLLIELTRADLSRELRVEEPIEFLMIDAMKSWPLANAISKSFLPNLIPSRSIVVQQDFGHYHPVTATNHILMWLMRDWFEPVYQVPASTSSVFFVRKKLTPADIPNLDPATLPADAIESAWRYSLGFCAASVAPSIWLCKILFLFEQGRFDAATHAVSAFRQTGLQLSHEARAGAAGIFSQLNPGALHSDAGNTARIIISDLLGLSRARRSS